MDEERILEHAINKAVDSNKILLNNKTYQIGLHDLYKESVEMAESISIHAVKGLFPKKLFKNKSPNQTDKEATYIEENYKQHSLDVFLDYLNTITRPFGDGNWAIDYAEDDQTYKDAEKTFQSYVESELPIYGSLENFIKFILPSIKSIDANGFLGIRPKEIDYVIDEEEELIVDSTELYKPTIFYYESKNVIDYEHGKYYLFLSKEKSKVEFQGRMQNVGTVFELYTPNAVYFIKQVGKKTESKFIPEEYYRHDLDDCCVKQLMGIPTLKGDEILWQSPFLYSTDILDTVLMNANYLQLSINSCVFPVKVMFGSPCDFRDSHGNICQDGKIIFEGKESICTSCNGVGLKSRVSPMGTFLLNPSTKFEVGEDKTTQDPLKYVSPEVHTLEFLAEKIEKDEIKARQILHLKQRSTKANITDDEIINDAKAMHSFVKPISDQIFSIYEFCLNIIGMQRYGESFNPPKLSYPKTFDFKSPEDYLNDVTKAMTANLPPSFIQTILMQYINSFYGDNAKSTQVFKIILSADRLFGLSNDEINMQIARGTVAKWEQVLHSSILMFILEQDESFDNKTIEEQVKILQEKAKEKALEILNSARQPTIPII